VISSFLEESPVAPCGIVALGLQNGRQSKQVCGFQPIDEQDVILVG